MEELSQPQLVGFIGTIVALLAYPIVLRVIADRVEPTRQRLDMLGKELLSSPNVSERYKVIVDGMLDDAYDWRLMASVVLRLPIFLFGRLLGFIKPLPLPQLPSDEDARKKLLDFISCHMRSVAAANPICSLIFALEVAVLVIFMVPLGMISRLAEISLKVILFSEDRGRAST